MATTGIVRDLVCVTCKCLFSHGLEVNRVVWALHTNACMIDHAPQLFGLASIGHLLAPISRP